MFSLVNSVIGVLIGCRRLIALLTSWWTVSLVFGDVVNPSWAGGGFPRTRGPSLLQSWRRCAPRQMFICLRGTFGERETECRVRRRGKEGSGQSQGPVMFWHVLSVFTVIVFLPHLPPRLQTSFSPLLTMIPPV